MQRGKVADETQRMKKAYQQVCDISNKLEEGRKGGAAKMSDAERSMDSESQIVAGKILTRGKGEKLEKWGALETKKDRTGAQTLPLENAKKKLATVPRWN